MTDNRTTELMPCPFCGGEACLSGNMTRSDNWIICRKCGVFYPNDTRRDFTEAEAVAAWNTRAELGSGTCHMSFVDEYETASGEEEYLCECSECGYRRWEPACDLPLFCSKCGKKVKR